MNIDNNSINSYREYKDTQEFHNITNRLLKVVRRVPLLTSREYHAFFFQDIELAVLRPRFTELQDVNIFVKEGSRECSISGKKCNVWRVVM